MTGSEIANMYEFSYGAIKRNLDDVTNEESLVQPPGAGNCLNWVLGHIVAARNTVLKLAGGAPVVGEDVAAHYRRGSDPLQAGEKVPDLATLRGLLSDTQHQLVPALAALSDDALDSACSRADAATAANWFRRRCADSSPLSRGLSQRTDRTVAQAGGKRRGDQVTCQQLIH